MDATGGEDRIVSEVLAGWAAPVHQGGCGDSGRLSKAEVDALKRYLPPLNLYCKGGDAVRATMQEAQRLADQLRAQRAQQRNEQQADGEREGGTAGQHLPKRQCTEEQPGGSGGGAAAAAAPG